MWGKKLKKRKAVDRWHTKAMLIDPRKVKITMLWTAEPNTSESVEDSGVEAAKLEIVEPSAIESAGAQVGTGSIEAFDLSFDHVGSLASAGADLLAPDPSVTDPPEVCVNAENLEAGGPSLEAFDLNLAEGQIAADSAEDLGSALPEVGDIEVDSCSVGLGVALTPTEVESSENITATGPKMESEVSSVAEPEKACQPAGELVVPALEAAEAPTAVASPEGQKPTEPIAAEPVGVAATDDCVYAVVSEGKEPVNVQFLRALEKTRSIWNGDAQFVKIVQKMQKGKTLKRKEFEQVYLHIHTYCQCH